MADYIARRQSQPGHTSPGYLQIHKSVSSPDVQGDRALLSSERKHPFVASTLFDKRLSGSIKHSSNKKPSIKYIERPISMLVREN